MAQKHVFADPECAPDKAALQAAFGGAYPLYEELLLLAAGFAQSWNYAKYSGWVLKIGDSKKALLYVLPQPGGFAASMALREAERDALLQNPALPFAVERLQAAKQYKEGFAVRLDTAGDDAKDVLAFVTALVALRQ